MNASEARSQLHALASPDVAASATRFFKTGPGQYGEGDTFIGVRVPAIRKLARQFRDLPLTEVEVLLHSPIHEERLLALLILVLGVRKCDDAHRAAVFDFYLGNSGHVNNWDLVDTSAPAIVGGYLRDRLRTPLLRLARSASLWERRIAIIATQHFVRLGEFDDTLAVSRLLLADKEDLITRPPVGCCGRSGTEKLRRWRRSWTSTCPSCPGRCSATPSNTSRLRCVGPTFGRIVRANPRPKARRRP